MHLSLLAVTLGALTGAAALAWRRDRLFGVVAVFAAAMAVDALLYNPLLRFGPNDPREAVLVLAVAVTLAEAIGLPRRIAELTRLGLRSAAREYDLRLWQLIGPFEQALADPQVKVVGFARENAGRLAARLLDRLGAARPPDPDWARVRDDYVGALKATQASLSGPDASLDPHAVWLAATDDAGRSLVALRIAEPATMRRRPPWAALILLITLPFTFVGPLDLANRTVIAPERPYGLYTTPPLGAGSSPAPQQISAGWTAMKTIKGDGWARNAVADRERVFLASREDVHGFWGAMRVRSTGDGGATWSSTGDPSNGQGSSAARQAVAIGPDGTVWVAYAQQGARVASQVLQIGRSTDTGLHWGGLVRASDPTVGLVGLPYLLITRDVRLVAYTDGATGAAMAQTLDAAGAPDGDPSVLGTTNRELYSDAEFVDAGFAIAADGSHVVALWHSTDRRIEVSTSDDAGRTWRARTPLSTSASAPAPDLIVSDGRFVALVTESGSLRNQDWIELDSSADAGTSWTHGPPLSDGHFALQGVVTEADGRWTLAYTACAEVVLCNSDDLRIWLRTSRDGKQWTAPEAIDRPGSYTIIGAGTTAAGRTWVMWVRYLSASDEDRVIEGAYRQDQPSGS